MPKQFIKEYFNLDRTIRCCLHCRFHNKRFFIIRESRKTDEKREEIKKYIFRKFQTDREYCIEFLLGNIKPRFGERKFKYQRHKSTAVAQVY